ncbi:MAG TPA: ABC transporter permease subunit [Nitrososphaerales archaeon]|nr:ABC transporter permease subunit [Nitrososphaerales archaeon]
MSLKHSWIIATKDLKAIRHRKTILYTLVITPIALSLLFGYIVQYAVSSAAPGTSVSDYAFLLDAFAFWFVIIAAILPSPIASYSIVGEKVERSLEPLLATPVTDGEILLGKSLAAFIPTILASYAGAAIYMAYADRALYGVVGYLYYPNWEMLVILLLLAPLTCLLSIELNVIISSRVTDVRAASQLGSVVFAPFMGLYIAGEIDVITLNAITLLVISAILAGLSVGMFYMSTRTFQREEILTKWK